MKYILPLLVLLSVSVFFNGPVVSADQLTLKDGSVLMGKVLQMVEGKVQIETSFAGKIEIPADQILRMETEEVKPIHLSDGSVIQGTIQTEETERLNVLWGGKEETKFSVTPEDITAIAPPPPPPPPTPTPVKWHGKVVGDLTVTDGNTETIGAGFSADLKRRTEDDRIALKGGYYYSEDDGKAIRDDQYILGKYDYFYSEKAFVYLNSRLDRDAIRDLRLRTTGGTGLGYQFLETDIYNFFGESGISYVNEDFVLDADDETYVAGRVALHFAWWIIKEKLRFEEDAEMLFGFENTKDWFAISDSSLIWQWTERWSSQAGLRFEYDNTPATGREKTDTKYTLGIGYSF